MLFIQPTWFTLFFFRRFFLPLLIWLPLTVSLAQSPAALPPTVRQATLQLPAFVQDSLDNYVRRGMTAWRIPGMAVVIVKDGQVVLAKGYGLQAMGRSQPVTADTRFPIASNTKLFTGVAVATLDEQKRLSLDEPVIHYLPDLKLYNADWTKLVSLRDLLSHRVGTRTFQGNFLYWNSTLSRQQVVSSFEHLVPSNPFRQTYGYCNTGYVAAGEVIAKVTGQSWDTYIQQLLLTPLAMTSTTTSMTGLNEETNIARGHTSCCGDPGQLQSLPFDVLDNIGASASIVSTANDLGKWLMMQLDSGRRGNQQIVPWGALAKTRVGNTILASKHAPTSPFPTQLAMYGLGTGLIDYNGSLLHNHLGVAIGFKSHVAFVPELRLGIAILVNQDEQYFGEALQYDLLDAFFGLPYANRNQYFSKIQATAQQRRLTEQKAFIDRVAKRSPLPSPIQTYCGQFRNALYGTLQVAVDPADTSSHRLRLSFEHHPNLSAWLDYMDDDTFRLSFSNPRYGITPAKVTRKGGQPSTIDIRISDFLDPTPYLFTRQ